MVVSAAAAAGTAVSVGIGDVAAVNGVDAD